ncbi:MAG TPA: LysE family translocator [Acetobacteraceae bacterium]|nr:LysE family translocator [Acetobacteraceae bacterium]
MTLTSWIAFTITYLIMAATPGPVILLVVSYALAQGRRAALAVVAGTALGDATCLAAALCGLGALLAASATAFGVIKLIGCAYLVFLGIRLWRAPPSVETGIAPVSPCSRPRSRRRIFLHAYLTTVFNPKSVLFFMMFVPQFLNPHASLTAQLALMLPSVLVVGFAVDGCYSLCGARFRRLIRTRRAGRAVNRLAGGVLVGEGVLAAAWRGIAF